MKVLGAQGFSRRARVAALLAGGGLALDVIGGGVAGVGGTGQAPLGVAGASVLGVHALAAVLTVGALMQLLAGAGAARDRRRDVLDGVVAASAVLLVSWVAVVEPAPALDGPAWVALAGVLLADAAVVGTAIILVCSTESRLLAYPARLGLAIGVSLFAEARTLWVGRLIEGAPRAVTAVGGDVGGDAAIGADASGWVLWLAVAAVTITAVVSWAGRSAGAWRQWLTVRQDYISALAPPAVVVVATLTVARALLRDGGLGAVASTLLLVTTTLVLAVAVTARVRDLRLVRRMDELVVDRTVTLGVHERWFRALVQNSSDVITVVDPTGVVQFQTPSMTAVLGHDPAALIGTRFTGLLRPSDGRRLQAALAEAVRRPGQPMRLELPLWHQSGGWRDTETVVTGLLDDPSIRGIVLNTRDVSDRRALQEELRRQAYSDPLTGLANRARFRERVQSDLTCATADGQLAVLFMDLDGFKAVNDSLGHLVGDVLLTVVAKRVTGAVRPGDLVARLGGDEFAILVTGVDAEQGALWVAERLRRSLAAPFAVDDAEVALGASVGLAVSGPDARTADQLLRNADLAMYRAKAARSHRVVRFEESMREALLDRVAAEHDLRLAVERGDLVVYYQPLVDLRSRRVTGAEALVRWRHPLRGLVGPDEFIGLAEQTGLVEPIGAWVLTEACEQAYRWQQMAGPGEVFHMAVNVSPRQLTPALPRLVRETLVASRLPPEALTLELTEGVLIDRPDEVSGLLARLHSLGVRIALDDFGTGYSSLSYLARFPVDTLKIDKSFVRHLGQECDSSDGELAAAIVRIAASLGLTTVAEGVETHAQCDVVTGLGCTLGQGFFFAEPMPAEQFDDMVADGGVHMGAGSPV